MERVGVFYATREGQARKVAQHIGEALSERGLEVRVHDVSDAEAPSTLARSQAAVVVGSVHLGKHERELLAFVRTHRPELESIPAAFLSVCGAESGAEKGATPEARAKAAAHVKEQLHAFTEATGWHPAHVRPVAGALVYTHYNPLVRWVMKKIAESESLPTDTSRDYEFTDWLALGEFARAFAGELHAPPSAAST
jgi:menaquinone-dependent protoporphyrinogen oxidase